MSESDIGEVPGGQLDVDAGDHSNSEVDGNPDEEYGRTTSEDLQEPETESGVPDKEERDNEVITKAARKLRSLLVEVLDDLRTHAPVRLSADFKITVADRRTFDLTVGTASPDEDRLIVKINPSAVSGLTPTETRKRPAESPALSTDADNPKRPRTNGVSPSPSRPAPTPHASGLAAAARQAHPTELSSNMDILPEDEENDRDPDEPNYLRNEFRLLSKQVQWVEQCRRTAAAEYRRREETWRTTSASFHDDNRIKRESHESWVANEMSRQVNMLGQLINEVRGLYPLVQNARWDSPTPHPLYPPTPVAPATTGVAYDTPLSFSSPYLQHAQLQQANNRAQRGRPRGRPRAGVRGAS